MHIHSRSDNLVTRSITLDFHFLCLPLSFVEKIEFLIKKYFAILVFFFNLKKNGSLNKKVFKINLFGDAFYFDDIYNFTYLQNVYIESFFLKKFIPEGSIVIDIGANIGQFNFFARHCLKATRVYSIEPIKSSFRLLKLNTRSKDISNSSEAKILSFAYNCAISTKAKEIFYIPGSTLIASKFKLQENSQEEIVECRKLDDLHDLDSIGKVDLLKIDTEGSEYEILATGKNMLRKTKYVFLEASINRKSSKQIIELLILLRKLLPNIRLIFIDRGFLVKGLMEAVNLLLVNEKKRL